MSLIATLLLALTAYLLGSLPFGVWVGCAVTGRDIRASGSGHSGATNTLRHAGWLPGLVVMLLDGAKGFVAVWLARRLGPAPWAPTLAAAAAVAGHCWPVFASFRGGMGLAAAGGGLLAMQPLAFVLGVGLAAAGSLVLRHSARGNALAGILIGPVTWLVLRDSGAALAGTAAGAVVAVRAMSDWRRVYRELWLDRDRRPGNQA